MAPLPTLPEWVTLEHEVQRILTTRTTMDGRLMRERCMATCIVSREKNLEKLKNYYATDTLSLEDQNSLLNEITAAKDMSRVHPLLD